MAVARYYRVTGLTSYSGGDLEISELQLYDASGRADAGAVLSCTTSPASGALAALGDADLSTVVRFSKTDIASPGFAIVWDFGAGVSKEIISARVGSSGSQSMFLAGFTVQSSADAISWSDGFLMDRFIWAGANAYAPVPEPGDVSFPLVGLLLTGNGVNESTALADASTNPKVVTAQYDTKISTALGYPSIRIDGTNDFFSYQQHADFDYGESDLTIEFWSYFVTAPGASNRVFQSRDGDVVAGLYLAGSGVSGGLQFHYATTSSSFAGAGLNFSIATGVARHIAITRYLGVFYVWYQGVLQGSYGGAGSVYFNVLDFWIWGGQSSPNRSVNAYFWNIRKTKNKARYLSNFTPLTSFPVNTSPNMTPSRPVKGPLHGVNTQRGSLTATPSVQRIQSGGLLHDVENGGRCAVAGIVKEKGTPNTPVARRVRLLRDRDAQLVRECWSDPVTGAFIFSDLDERHAYTAYAMDHTNNFRAVVADRLTAEVPA